MENEEAILKSLTGEQRHLAIEIIARMRGLPYNTHVLAALRFAADEHPEHTPKQVVDLVAKRRRMAQETLQYHRRRRGSNA